MTNWERFNNLVDDYLANDSTYALQIANFREFLSTHNLQEKVFILDKRDIDDYFIYSFNEKIGYENSLTSHISALKSLFDFLISSNKLNYSEINGYINTSVFRDKMRKKLEKTFPKASISDKLLKKILIKIDEYIITNYDEAIKNDIRFKRKYFEIIISQIYIKLSLILPLKTSQMLTLKLSNMLNDEIRTITYKGFIIKIPNSVRKEIIFAINFAQQEFKLKYSENDQIFEYLYRCISKKAESGILSQSLTKAYNELNITEMLEQKSGGKKTKYIYPAESYKKTALKSMIENGANIVYLSKLTGLDVGTLAKDCNVVRDVISTDAYSDNINSGIILSSYFTYL